MKKRAPLAWRLFFSYLLIVFATLGSAGWYFVDSLEGFLQAELVGQLTSSARLLQLQLLPYLQPANGAAIDAICKRAGSQAGVRFTVILPSGLVLGDTAEAPEKMEKHSTRPEVTAALAQGVASARRYSTTLKRNVIYVATAMPVAGEPAAVVRAAVPLSQLEQELARVRTRFIAIGALFALLALLLTMAISQRYGRKIRRLQEGAARLAEGDLSHRLQAPESQELAGIADSLNRMATLLESRMQAIVSQRNQLEVVLSSMLEGVIALDHEERVISLNQAAARWLELPLERVQGRSLQEVIRNLTIQNFVSRSLQSRTPAEEDMVVFHNGERILNVKSTPLQGAASESFGTLIVFSDVTQLRRLENMRRDFVANVSHELKTPLTAIKGFVETLQQGRVEPREAARFLKIIGKHVDRLSVIIDDLLMLSRIENSAQRAQIEREPTRLRDLFNNAVQVCRQMAEEKHIRIQVAGEEALSISVDPVLLEQAIVNLLDNALKYSEAEREVELTAGLFGREIQIKVRDQGIGIERKHLPRLFERFYRVDKARSRAMGGTGLGLAIVKHIAQAHGGHVSVESALGEGSCFTIHLPREPIASNQEVES